MRPEYAAYLDRLIEERRMEFHESVRDALSRGDVLRAQCQRFSRDFVKMFPNLKLQPGFFGADPTGPDVVPDFSYVEHWWCVDEDGTIVDPTREQFGNSQGRYWPYDENVHRVHLGRCMNCGDHIYGLRRDGHQSVCGLECEIALTAYHEREFGHAS